MAKEYNRYNFFKHTFCEWKSVDDFSERKEDYNSKSGSRYFFTSEGVYRISNHWGRAANCRWRLLTSSKKSQVHQVGYANWSDFYPNNDTDLFYFIEVDWQSRLVRYQHKYNDKKKTHTYRSALETVKRIKLITTVLDSEIWAKYLDYEDIEEITRFFVARLIATNESLIEIKKAWTNGEKE